MPQPRPSLAMLRALIVLGLATACAPQPRPAPPAAAADPVPGPTATAAPVAWPAEPSCPEALHWLANATAAGRLPASPEGAPLAVREETLDGAAAGGRWIVDLPLPTADPGREPRCLLVLAPPRFVVERRELARRELWSERVTGVERRPNPEYERTRREVERLADRLDKEDRAQARDVGRLTATGNPLIDGLALLGGMALAGLGQYARDNELAEAKARLDTIPRFLEEERVEAYRVAVSETELVRRGRLRLALVDQLGARQWAIERPLELREVLAVADGLHPRDRGGGSGGRLVDRAALELAAAAPVPVRLSDQVAGLAAAVAASEGRPGGLAALLAAWAAPSPTTIAAAAPAPPAATAAPASARRPATLPPDPAAAERAIVRVAGAGGEARGFYIGRDKIVTLKRVLGPSSLVEVRTADGFTTWAVLDHERDAPDLVLLHVPRPGPAVALAPAGAGPPTLGSLPPPGAPILSEAGVIAVSLDPEAGRVADREALARLLAGLKGF